MLVPIFNWFLELLIFQSIYFVLCTKRLDSIQKCETFEHFQTLRSSFCVKQFIKSKKRCDIVKQHKSKCYRHICHWSYWLFFKTQNMICHLHRDHVWHNTAVHLREKVGGGGGFWHFNSGIEINKYKCGKFFTGFKQWINMNKKWINCDGEIA